MEPLGLMISNKIILSNATSRFYEDTGSNDAAGFNETTESYETTGSNYIIAVKRDHVV